MDRWILARCGPDDARERKDTWVEGNMDVAQLRKRLVELGASATGSKDVLAERLRVISGVLRPSSGDAPAAKRAAKAQAAPAAKRARTGAVTSRTQAESAPQRRPAAALSSGRSAGAKRNDAASGRARRAEAAKSAPQMSRGMRAEMAKYQKSFEQFSSWTNDKLKALLKANDQSRSGNKAVLVAKVADGAAFGRLPRCPTCYGGKIKFRLPGPDGELVSLFRLHGGAYGEDKVGDQKAAQATTKRRYYCTGYFDDDEKVDCSWQVDKVKRLEWCQS